MVASARYVTLMVTLIVSGYSVSYGAHDHVRILSTFFMIILGSWRLQIVGRDRGYGITLTAGIFLLLCGNSWHITLADSGGALQQ